VSLHSTHVHISADTSRKCLTFLLLAVVHIWFGFPLGSIVSEGLVRKMVLLGGRGTFKG
jgi:hypothetical protein